MKYETEVKVAASPHEVFDAIHRYKVIQKPEKLFDVIIPEMVKMNFQVLTENMLGLGAVYDWNITLFGIPFLQFREKVVKWKPGRMVAHRAFEGCQMFFLLELEHLPDGTLVKIEIDFSPFRMRLLDWLFRPVVKWALKKMIREINFYRSDKLDLVAA